jgi:Ca2+-binding RTX toxin-like protein
MADLTLSSATIADERQILTVEEALPESLVSEVTSIAGEEASFAVVNEGARVEEVKSADEITTVLAEANVSSAEETVAAIESSVGFFPSPFHLIIGTPFPDFLVGTAKSEIILGLQGNDFLYGKGGNDSIFGGDGDDFLLGDFPGIDPISNDLLSGEQGNDVLYGGAGKDFLNGGNGFDTADYTFLGAPITLEAVGIVNKGKFGTDQIFDIERIVGAFGQPNAIDGSTGTSGVTSFDVDLSVNSLTVQNIPGLGNVTFVVENFVNVTGTSQGDQITGNNQNNLLIGGEGNDTISGLGGNDTIIGVNPNSATPGVNEFDSLTGGTGADKFVLGENSQVYYQGGGFFGTSDYADITDFETSIDQIQLTGNLNDYIFFGSSPTTFSGIFLDTNSNNVIDTSDDLIAFVGGTGFTQSDVVFA